MKYTLTLALQEIVSRSSIYTVSKTIDMPKSHVTNRRPSRHLLLCNQMKQTTQQQTRLSRFLRRLGTWFILENAGVLYADCCVIKCCKPHTIRIIAGVFILFTYQYKILACEASALLGVLFIKKFVFIFTYFRKYRIKMSFGKASAYNWMDPHMSLLFFHRKYNNPNSAIS